MALRSREAWFCVAIVVGTWALVTLPIWLRGETYFLRDFWNNCVPARAWLRNTLAHGELGLWNPLIGGGLPGWPEAANSPFYVPAWPFLLLKNQGWALSALVSLHLLLGAFGTYLLARRRTGRWGATAAALILAVGGLSLSNLINVQFAYAFAWMPLWFWALLRHLDRAERSDPLLPTTLGLAAIWAAQLLAPDPQIAYTEGLAVLVALGARLADHRLGARQAARVLGGVALAAIGSALVAAVQLAPMVEALQWTNRSQLGSSALLWSLHPLRLWELVLPLPWGALAPVTEFWGKALVGGQYSNFYFYSLYGGALLLPLSLLGVRWRGKGEWVLVGGVGLLLLGAMGLHTPVYGGLRALLPVWKAFRYPERLVMVPVLAVALAGGIGLERLAGSKTGRWRALVLVAPALAGIAWLAPGLLGPGGAEPLASSVVARSATHALIYGVLGVVVALLAPEKLRAGLLTLVLAVDLLSISGAVQPTWVPPPLADPPASTAHRILMPTSIISRATDTMPPKPALRMAFENAASRPNLNLRRGYATTNAVSSLEPRREERLRAAVGPAKTALLYDTGTFVGLPGMRLPGFDETNLRMGQLTLYQARQPPGLVSCYADWTAAASEDEAVAAVRSGRTTFEDTATAPLAGPKEPVPCQWQRVSQTKLEVTLAPRATPTLVVFRENFYPGWRARLASGRATPVHPADVAMLGTVVPPGSSAVIFEYRPSWLLPAFLVSLLGLLGLAGGALWSWRRARLTRAPQRA